MTTRSKVECFVIYHKTAATTALWLKYEVGLRGIKLKPELLNSDKLGSIIIWDYHQISYHFPHLIVSLKDKIL